MVFVYDIESGDGAIMFRLEGKPVGAAGTDIPERIENALSEEFDEPLELTRRDVPDERYYDDGGI